MSTQAPTALSLQIDPYLRIGISAARFNAELVDELLAGCVRRLNQLGVADHQIDIVRVPGAFELPVTARAFADSGRYAAIICLGAVVRGDTPHFDFVAGECARGLQDVAIKTGLPVIFGVLTTNTRQQALDRIGGSHGHAGERAAEAAVEMINVLHSIVTGGPQNRPRQDNPERESERPARETAGGRAGGMIPRDDSLEKDRHLSAAVAVILMGASGNLKDLASKVKAPTHRLDPSEYLTMTPMRTHVHDPLLPPMHLLTADNPAWRSACEGLVAQSRDPYFDPAWSAASARWEKANAACLIQEPAQGRTFLYPFLTHPLPFPTADQQDIQTPYGYGGPLFTGDWSDDQKQTTLADLAITLRAQGAIAEFVRCHPDLTDHELLAGAGYTTFQVRTNVECDLSANDFTQSWHPTARRNLRKAVGSGLTWRATDDPSADDLQTFCRLYLATADRLSMAAHYRFDLSYIQAILAVPGARLIVVETTAAPAARDPAEYDAPGPIAVAAAIVLLSPQHAYYHLGASDFAFQQLRPNDFLYFAMATLARRHGCQKIAWGGGTSNDPEDSLFRFKSHFGDLQKPVYCAGRILDPEAFEHQWSQWRAAHPDRQAKMFLKYRA